MLKANESAFHSADVTKYVTLSPKDIHVFYKHIKFPDQAQIWLLQYRL